LRDLPTLVRHRRAMWADIGIFPDADHDAADRQYRRWVRAEWARRRFFAWIAMASDASVAASGALWLQPVQPRPNTRKTLQPYLLSFYTEPAHRRQGLADALVRACTAWSQARGYPRVSLHASPAGAPVYARLGFKPTPEMRIDLAKASRAGGAKRQWPRRA
jgi:GNAT superfamily N-acetyltransferase